MTDEALVRTATVRVARACCPMPRRLAVMLAI